MVARCKLSAVLALYQVSLAFTASISNPVQVVSSSEASSAIFIPSISSHNVAAPLPPPGFKPFVDVDLSVTLRPIEVYLNAVHLMSYLSSQVRWSDVVSVPISIAGTNFKTEAEVDPVHKDFTVEIAVQGLYYVACAVSERGAFHRIRGMLTINGTVYGIVRFQPSTRLPPDVLRLDSNVVHDDLMNASRTVTAGPDDGRIYDPQDPEFSIAYHFTGKTIKASDVFTSFMNAMAIAAEHENWDLNAAVPAAPSAGKGDTVLSTWTIGAKDNPRMSWLKLKRTLLILWERVVVARTTRGLKPRFEEFFFDLEYTGVRFGGGALLRLDKAVESTNRTAVARRGLRDIH